MLHNLKKRKLDAKGFTIIEVLIVLAIASLILVIVFLAVPALQRNSRNTQRKNDVQALLGGTTEFFTNNPGSVPLAYNTGTKEITGAVGTTTPAGVKIGYYNAVTFAAGAQAVLPATSDTVRIVTGARCGAAGVTVAGSSRQVATQYKIEGTSGLVDACQDS